MKTARAKSSWLAETGMRLDAAYHLGVGRQAKLMLEKSPLGTMRVGDAASRIFYGGRARRYFVSKPELGVPFMGSGAMFKADLDGLKLASKKLTPDLAASMLEPGWTLIARSGTVSLGMAAYSNGNFVGKAASEDVIRVVPSDKIPSGYLYAFLASEYGYGLLTQGIFGAVIQHIEPAHVAEIPLPLLPAADMERIHTLVEEAGRLRVKAQKLRGGGGNSLIINALKANHLLEKPVDKFKAVSAQRITDSYTLRLEASYYTGLSEKLVAHFDAQGIAYKSLGEVAARIFKPNIFKRTFVKHGIPFLGGGEMQEANPKPDKQLSRTRTAGLKELMLGKYWTLITRGGTIGNTLFTHEGHAQMAASEHVLRVVAGDEMPAGYLHAYLASPIGKAFITDYTYGSVIPQIEPHHLQRMPVPVLPVPLQQEIHDKLVQATDAMYQANQLENEAIHLVESAIAAWQ